MVKKINRINPIQDRKQDPNWIKKKRSKKTSKDFKKILEEGKQNPPSNLEELQERLRKMGF